MRHGRILHIFNMYGNKSPPISGLQSNKQLMRGFVISDCARCGNASVILNVVYQDHTRSIKISTTPPQTIPSSSASCPVSPVIKDRRLILIMDHFQRAAHNRCFHTAAANGADNGSVLKD